MRSAQRPDAVITLDVHGLSAFSARAAVSAALRRAGGAYRISVIHGYHAGTALRDAIRTSFADDPRVLRVIAREDGRTELVLREIQMYTVYILRCGDGSLYTGVTTDLDRRVAVHNSGKGAKYTRAHLPVSAVYSEQAASRAAAQTREREIKRLTRAEKLLLIGAPRA